MNLFGRPFHYLGALLALLLLVSCGGGGASSSGVPTISHLSYSPQAVYVSSSPVTFQGQFAFADPDGNLSSVTLTVRDSKGAVVSSLTQALQGVTGMTSGTIQGTVIAQLPAAGQYALQVYVTDTAQQQSNVLTGPVRIANFPWTVKKVPPTARQDAAAAALNGVVYVMGGQLTNTDVTPGPATNVVEIYDPATDSWTSGPAVPPLPTARMGLVGAVLNGKLYAIGGRTDGYTTSAVGTVEMFDPAIPFWTTKNPLPNPRYFAAGEALNGQIFIAGGEWLGGELSDMAAYTPLTNAWSGQAALPLARSELGTGVIDGRLYAVGGYAGSVLQWVGRMDVYDPLSALWSAAAPLPTARAAAATIAVNGQLFVAGGENQTGALYVLESYDPSTDTWHTRTPSPQRFTRAGAATVNNKVYIFANGLTLEYDPANEIY